MLSVLRMVHSYLYRVSHRLNLSLSLSLSHRRCPNLSVILFVMYCVILCLILCLCLCLYLYLSLEWILIFFLICMERLHIYHRILYKSSHCHTRFCNFCSPLRKGLYLRDCSENGCIQNHFMII